MYSFDDIITYNWIELKVLSDEISNTNQVFNKLLKNLNQSLINIKAKHNKEVEEDEKFNDGEERSVLQLEELVINELERQQYYAYCFAVHSSFEGKLKRICNKIETEPFVKIKLADSKGDNDLKKYYNYLNKGFEMNVTKTEQYYQAISKHKIIRNMISHNNGIITGVEKNEISKLNLKHLEFEMIEERPVLEENQLFQIKLTNDYLLVLNENISSFYKELIPAIDERYKILKQN